jgi:predicted Zn-dependent protease
MSFSTLARRRASRMLVASASLLLVLGAGIGWFRLQGQPDLQKGLNLFQQGRFEEAERILRQVAARQPNDVGVLKALADAQLASEQWQAAEDSLSRWCTLQPGQAEPLERRLELYLRLGKNEQAASDGLRLLERNPGDLERCRKVVWLYLGIGRAVEAEQACRLCLQWQPGHAQLRYLLAECLHARGAEAEAQAILAPLVRAHPQLAAALMLRALYLLYDAGRASEAIPLLRQVLLLDEQRQEVARYHLSQALARTGQKEEAERVLAEMQWLQARKRLAGDGHPDNLELQARVAEGLLGAGKSEEARHILRKILEQDASYATAHRLLASYYERQGQTAKAAEHIRKAGQ